MVYVYILLVFVSTMPKLSSSSSGEPVSDKERNNFMTNIRHDGINYKRSLEIMYEKFGEKYTDKILTAESARRNQWFGVQEIEGKKWVFAQIVSQKVHDITKGDIRWVCVMTWQENAECMKKNDEETMKQAINDAFEGFENVKREKQEYKREKYRREREARLADEARWRARQEEIRLQEEQALATALKQLNELEAPFLKIAVDMCVSHEDFRNLPGLTDEIRELFVDNPLATITGTNLSNDKLIKLIEGAVKNAIEIIPKKPTKSAQMC